MTTADLLAPAPQESPAPAAAGSEVFQRLGHLTRQLHDALHQLGVMPRLQQAAQGLPDARSRLHYVAGKTADAADRVLTAVEQAKAEQACTAERARDVARALAADPARALASGAVLEFVGELEASTARVDRHLTDIMLAQDFHDLTGQVVARVVALATDLEDSLVGLLLQAAPAPPAEGAALAGPVVDPRGRADVVCDQREVDELLADLGF
jgi:chemotaxis protein CheZ